MPHLRTLYLHNVRLESVDGNALQFSNLLELRLHNGHAAIVEVMLAAVPNLIVFEATMLYMFESSEPTLRIITILSDRPRLQELSLVRLFWDDKALQLLSELPSALRVVHLHSIDVHENCPTTPLLRLVRNRSWLPNITEFSFSWRRPREFVNETKRLRAALEVRGVSAIIPEP
ncbi:hypothetical protein EMMF5_001333 [Cystobasidiomycetes sp. EMM_F5]